MIVSRVRRSDLEADEATLTERGEAKDRGSHKPQLQYPQIDLTLCLGCGTCIKACPEDGVLGLIHGQAAVIHGARCVGIAACAIACPPGAIAVRIEDLENRKDIPALTDDLEVIGVPGLFLAGEVTGFALVRTAVMHGQKVANQVAERVATPVAATAGATAGGIAGAGDILDLCIIGCGPAGFSCSLQSKAKGLNFATIEREEIGGTVAKYPRRKLVMTQPMDLPLHGRLKKLTYLKEELMEIWLDLAREHDLPIHTGEAFLGIERDSQGVFTVKTKSRSFRARHVCFCLGRRGTPRKLGVPGEELPKVLYSLVDAQSFEGRHILVVGGGDSAIEAAVGLSEQPGNTVTLSYRKSSFFRMKAKNEKRITEAEATGRIDVIFESQVLDCVKNLVPTVTS
ncbi:MAG: NAD(P)-binding domain-containing protein, partial [Planctomycetota bacterium]